MVPLCVCVCVCVWVAQPTSRMPGGLLGALEKNPSLLTDHIPALLAGGLRKVCDGVVQGLRYSWIWARASTHTVVSHARGPVEAWQEQVLFSLRTCGFASHLVRHGAALTRIYPQLVHDWGLQVSED